LFADDAKLYRSISTDDDFLSLQKDCQKLFDWSSEWKMSLNVKKCKVLSIARNKNTTVNYNYGFKMVQKDFVELEHVSSITDLGVIMDHELNFNNHIYEKINKSNQMLGIIKRNFRHLDMKTFLLLYVALVRSHIEYASSVWNPFRISLITALEKIQKRATKIIKECKNLSYIDRLKLLNIPTLKFRRVRGDMIETFKILNGIYDSHAVPILPRNSDTRTRGNSLKLLHVRSTYDVRKFSFASRIVNLWNSLPDHIILSDSVNSFKNRLDNHWKNEDMYFNWEASIAGY
jgi:hypothetical protein